MGADALADLPLTSQAFEWAPYTGKERTAFLAPRFAANGVEALVVVGGDGALADVAFSLYRAGVAAPILGIGAGSANVGPLVTCQAAEVGRLAGAQFTERTVDGLIAGANGAELGLGFNDVVISTTVLATVDGAVVDVDAREKMRGRNIPAAPVARPHHGHACRQEIAHRRDPGGLGRSGGDGDRGAA